MKKTLLISLAFLSIAGFAYAQLVGTERILDNQWLTDDKQIQMGNLPDVACEYDTNQTNDAMVCGLSADSERLIITQKADMGTNFGLSDLGSPGITFMSSDATRSGTIYNDGTNLVIDVSAGSVSVPDGITGAIIGNADTATALAANPSDCTSGQFATAIAASGNLTCGALATDLAITTTLTNAAGASANPVDVTSTLGIMNGSDDYTAIDVNITNANHTGSNTVQGLDISGITADTEATETAINIGNGWDAGINAGNNSITTTGPVSGALATFTSGNFTEGNITNVGDISLDSILSDATNGQIVIGGSGGASNNERLTLDFETVANKATISSSTGVTQVDYGTIGLKSSGGLDLSGSNINGANQILANGSITSASTTDIGWSRVAVANQACNTTCTFACVFGQETTSKDILACTDATADVCVCAGAN